jgi:hypothetical protein
MPALSGRNGFVRAADGGDAEIGLGHPPGGEKRQRDEQFVRQETAIRKPAPDCHRETVLKLCKPVGEFSIVRDCALNFPGFAAALLAGLQRSGSLRADFRSQSGGKFLSA